MTQYITLPKRAKDITNQRFGRLIALGPVGQTKFNRILWLCQCDCGGTVVVQSLNLNSGDTQSCGCIQKTILELRNTTHGMREHPLYRRWKAMISRCTNPNTAVYANYGGRGIEVCSEWKESFKAYHDYVTQLSDYGTSGYTLDRIDNDGNYEPGNVRWASPADQTRNSRHSRLITHDGRTQCLRDWANELGIGESVIDSRIRRGWTIERALTTPVT